MLPPEKNGKQDIRVLFYDHIKSDKQDMHEGFILWPNQKRVGAVFLFKNT